MHLRVSFCEGKRERERESGSVVLWNKSTRRKTTVLKTTLFCTLTRTTITFMLPFEQEKLRRKLYCDNNKTMLLCKYIYKKKHFDHREKQYEKKDFRQRKNYTKKELVVQILYKK
eukprot:GEMP01107964.1.p2 GENE.GEMP01107964.1~~GEMP01107964.1.p2  ORF type:complete len:115 (+),score=2.03 GEMP01107964.1:372-716(+)